jgi:Tol biopolymer transport system component
MRRRFYKPLVTLAPGTRLGAYEILSLIGSGGMGEVYRARDPRLGREVAVKVLPAAVSTDPDRLHRFEQEARAAAALSHPNILTIHEISSADGTLYVVSELLEGQTLREVLGRGALPTRTAVAYAVQILNGLAAAHDKGIVHRDLKPENLFVTTDGRVKILDFGLAKLLEPMWVGAGASMLATSPPHTTPGAVLGTVGYMSPEQVRGHAAEPRSDLFSFGVILYEMLSGERPFKGDSPADTMSAILRVEPRELSVASGGSVSPGLERTVQHCLEKDPGQRFQSARDLAFDLESLSGISTAAPAEGIVGHPWYRRRAGVILGAAVVIVFGGLAIRLFDRALRRGPSTPIVTQVRRFTHEPGVSEWPTWSPDGSLLAFASDRNGHFDVYVRRVEGGHEVNVTNNASDNVQPAFSPDGTSIAFVSTRTSRTRLVRVGQRSGDTESRAYGGDVWIVPTLGGQARRAAANGNFPVWHPSGRKIAFVSGPEAHRSILEVALAGGMPQAVVPSDGSAWEITHVHYAPHAGWITFETAEGEIFIVPTAGGRVRKLANGVAHVWEPSGTHLYYCVRDSGGGTRLESVSIDESTGSITAQPSAISLMTGFLRDLAVSDNGQHLAFTEVEGSMNLTRLPLTTDGRAQAGVEQLLSAGQVFDGQPRVSPDGQRIAYTSNRLGHDQIWVLHVDSGQMEVLQFPGDDLGATGPHWYPDGRRLIAQRLFPNGKLSLWWIAADASSAEEVVSLPSLINNAEGWPIAPDGRTLIYGANVDGHSQLFTFDLRTRQATQITFSADDKFNAVWSPDGRSITFVSNANGSGQLWRIPAGGGEAEALTNANDRVRHAFYSPDGRWLYFQPNHLNIYRMPDNRGSVQQVTHFPESGLFLEEPTISPDGRYLVYCRSNGGSSLWVLTLGQEHAVRPNRAP